MWSLNWCGAADGADSGPDLDAPQGHETLTPSERVAPRIDRGCEWRDLGGSSVSCILDALTLVGDGRELANM